MAPLCQRVARHGAIVTYLIFVAGCAEPAAAPAQPVGPPPTSFSADAELGADLGGAIASSAAALATAAQLQRADALVRERPRAARRPASADDGN